MATHEPPPPPPDVAAALAAARTATDDLDAADPKLDEFRRRVEGAAAALHKWPPDKGDWPGVPNKRDHLRDGPTNGPYKATRTAWYTAMEHLHKLGWVKMDNAELMQRKRQKKQHARTEQAARDAAAVSTASFAQSSTQPLNMQSLPLSRAVRASCTLNPCLGVCLFASPSSPQHHAEGLARAHAAA